MLKVGFRVCPIYNMGMKGEIIQIYEISPSVEMMGGPLSKVRVAKVRLDADQRVIDIKISELMRID